MKDRNEWRTPHALVNFCSELVGSFNFDTACTQENAVARPIGRDALIMPWTGKCFCNPPYDNIDPWINKAFMSREATTIMVLPSPNGENRYAQLLEYAFEWHIIGRVSFIGTNGKPETGNPRGTSIFMIDSLQYPLYGRVAVLRDSMVGAWHQPAPVWQPEADA